MNHLRTAKQSSKKPPTAGLFDQRARNENHEVMFVISPQLGKP
jgi:hypothetical protein